MGNVNLHFTQNLLKQCYPNCVLGSTRHTGGQMANTASSGSQVVTGGTLAEGEVHPLLSQ